MTRDVRGELRELLHVGQAHHARLLKLAEDSSVPAGRLIEQVNVLERLDDQRDELIRQLKDDVSLLERRRHEVPARLLVKDALEEIGSPQRPAFLEDYIWARRSRLVEARTFAALRRDDRVSWEKNPDGRAAYLLPALTPDGKPVPSLITRSDWPLERRILASEQTERLFELARIIALLEVGGGSREDDIRDPLDGLLESQAQQLLGIEPSDWQKTDARIAWCKRVRAAAEMETDRLEDADAPARKAAAKTLSELTQVEQWWGHR